MDLQKLKDRILNQIGCVSFPETVIENCLFKLKKNEETQKYADELLKNYAVLDNTAYVIEARQHKYMFFCHLVWQLLQYYCYDDIDCLVVHQYFRAVNHDLEINISWYATNTDKVFKVKPTTELQDAENRLWNYLEEKQLTEKNKLRLRHLLTVFFLFFDYINNLNELEKFITLIENKQLNLKIS